VLRRIFGPKRDKVTGEWRKLHNDGLNDPYSSPNIVRVKKSKRLAVHVAWLGRREACTGYWYGNLGERGHWGDLGVNGG
jgi:hypothetical protein